MSHTQDVNPFQISDSGPLVDTQPHVGPRKFTEYKYSEDGVERYVVVRVEPGYKPGEKKTFRQKHRDADGRYVDNMEGVERILYRLDELRTGIAANKTVLFVEGEKDVDGIYSTPALAARYVATTVAQGAKATRGAVLANLPPRFDAMLAGSRRVVVIADNDKPGQLFAATVADRLCAEKSRDVRLIEALPVKAKGDVSDFLAEHDAGDLVDLIESAAPHTPSPASDDPQYSDLHNAQRLVDAYADRIRWVEEGQHWLHFDGKRWRPDSAVAIQGLAQHVLTAESHRLKALPDFRRAVTLGTKLLASMNRVSGMVSQARSMCGISVTKLDQHTHLLNVQNGTLDLHTGELRPHDPSDFITKIVPVEYDPNATAPNFEAAIRAATGSDELLDYVQQLFGWTLEGDTGTRRAWFVYGPSGTGKSTFFGSVLRAMLGSDYSMTINLAALSKQRNENAHAAQPEIIQMKGARFIVATETRESNALDASMIKRLTGGDWIKARALNAMPVDFQIEGKIVIYGNEKPSIPEADEATWVRMKLIPFEHQIPPSGQDQHYFEKVLLPELPGILAWAVRGHQRLRAANYMLNDPEVVRAATAEYRQEQNRLTSFIAARCELNPNAETLSADLRDAYRGWCEAVKNAYALSERSFARELKLIPGVEATKIGKKGDRGFKGIALRPHSSDRNDEGDF